MSVLLLLRSGQVFTQSVTDTLAGSDTAVVQTAFAWQVDELLAATDATSLIAAHVQSVQDTLGLSDRATWADAFDTLGLTDSVTFSFVRSITDSSGATDSAVENSGRAASISDNEALTDTLTKVSNTVYAVADSTGLFDLLSFGYTTTINDSAGLTDPFIAPRLLSTVAGPDDAGLTDLFSYSLNAARSVVQVDDGGLTDTVLVAGTHILALSDTLAGSDAATTFTARGLTVVDSAGSTDTVVPVNSPPTNWTQSVVDTLAGSDAVLTARGFGLSVTDLAGSTDSTNTLYLKTWLQYVLDNSSLSDTISTAANFTLEIVDNIGLDVSVQRSQNRVNSGRVIQMVEYVNRMQD
jgi:hypothetical protein